MKKVNFLSLILHLLLVKSSSHNSWPFIHSLDSPQNLTTLNSLISDEALDEESCIEPHFGNSKTKLTNPKLHIHRGHKLHSGLFDLRATLNYQEEYNLRRTSENSNFSPTHQADNYIEKNSNKNELIFPSTSELPSDEKTVKIEPKADTILLNTKYCKVEDQSTVFNIQEFSKIQFRDPETIKNLQIHNDLIHFIYKLVYFRKDLFKFINSCFSEDNNHHQNSYSPPKNLFKDNPEYVNLFTHNSKIIVKNLLLLVYITLELAKKNENHREHNQKYHLFCNRITSQKNKINALNSKINDQKLEEEELIRLKNELERRKKKVAELEFRRGVLPKKSSYLIVYKYARYLSNLKSDFGHFKSRWISIFTSLNKITNFYDLKWAELINDHLDEFICPAFYDRRDYLIDKNLYIDMDSFTFIILDWIFYFFSKDFQNQFGMKTNFSSKLLSRLTALIFILFNDPETVEPLFSSKEFLKNWILKLECKFESLRLSNSPCDFFNEIKEKIINFDGSLYISERNFCTRVSLGYEIVLLPKLVEILQNYLLYLYKIGFGLIKSND